METMNSQHAADVVEMAYLAKWLKKEAKECTKTSFSNYYDTMI